MDNKLKDSTHEAGGPLRASCHLQKGEPLLVFYDGQYTRMLGLHELRSLHNDKDRMPIKRPKHGTNFHSLARDVEQEGTGHLGEEKWRLLDNEANKREDFLLGMTSEFRSAVWKKVKAELLEVKKSAFTEVYRMRGAGERRGGLPGSAFSPVPSRMGRKMDTIFKSGKGLLVSDSRDTTDISGDLGYHHLLIQRDCLTFPNSMTILPLTDNWPKCETVSSPQVLPSTFTTLGSTAQIWCAKCKLSFRMTSDLVLHMRLRHKKDPGVETQSRRPRELQLTCPVCYAYFRERHHLSRHMTSHC
ncbi:hypothetical protein GDO81_022456 [Engystomops pustulosus]|uniref:C2H2-type domain-containing protein n=1 Tax=Engystomops pustulosus TaxID=76066 RepID=A0AAV6YNN5_ENGPU|nr:hypothetical protein GDO81_022456 [Engystomops pustulosus]